MLFNRGDLSIEQQAVWDDYYPRWLAWCQDVGISPLTQKLAAELAALFSDPPTDSRH